MFEVMIIGIDLVKCIFYLYGVGYDGFVVFCKRFLCGQLFVFMFQVLWCVVVMEVCVMVYGWGCVFEMFGYEVCLILLVYVKLFVKCQKNDCVDVEVIVEVVVCLIMCFVVLKIEDQ